MRLQRVTPHAIMQYVYSYLYMLTYCIFADNMEKMKEEVKSKLIKLASHQRFIRSRDVSKVGATREYLSELVEEGSLLRSGRGVYAFAESDVTEHHNLAEVAFRVPHAVIALISALRFHNLTTQNPHQIWIAVERGQRKPSLDYPPLRVFNYAKANFNSGIEEHKLEGQLVKVYSIEKTIADCFKFRNKIGHDVAIEALADARKGRKFNYNRLYQYAKENRVAHIIRPYVEALSI